jgi:hypothetical protein
MTEDHPIVVSFITKVEVATKHSRALAPSPYNRPLPNIPQVVKYPIIEIERDMPECEARNL